MTTLKDYARDLIKEAIEKADEIKNAPTPREAQDIIEDMADDFIDTVIKRLVGLEL